MEKKTNLVSARVTDSIRARLDAINKKHLTTDSVVLAASLEAFLDYVERTGKVEFPVTMIAAEAPKNKRAAS